MSPKRKKLIFMVIIFTAVIIVYILAWLPEFRQFQEERNTYGHYQDLLELAKTKPVKENIDSSPNLLIGQLQIQTENFRTDNRLLLAQLTELVANQKQEALSALADIAFLEEETSLLDKEYQVSDRQKLQNAADNVSAVNSVDNLENLLTDKNYLEGLISELSLAISKQVQARSQTGQWLNPLWGKTLEELQVMAEKMDAGQAAGQLLMFAAEGSSLTQDYQNLLLKQQPGGLIFMGGNIQNQQQISSFTKAIQKLSPDKLPLPMLLATDQEGGPVKRITWDNTPGETAWANQSDEQICSLAKQRAEILKQAGINTNFSPVVDLAKITGAYINNRTISGDPQIVTSRAASYVSCLQSSGIFATLKHFPGHGTTDEDSHLQLPVITKKRTDWLQSDALPFQNITSAKMIMVGHLLFTDLDKDNPATQSEKIIDKILRKRMKFNGVIITDDLKQLTSSTKVSSKEAMKKAYNSGIDIVLYLTTRENEQQALTELEKMITANEIPRRTVNEALFRILKLKSLINF